MQQIQEIDYSTKVSHKTYILNCTDLKLVFHISIIIIFIKLNLLLLLKREEINMVPTF